MQCCLDGKILAEALLEDLKTLSPTALHIREQFGLQEERRADKTDKPNKQPARRRRRR